MQQQHSCVVCKCVCAALTSRPGTATSASGGKSAAAPLSSSCRAGQQPRVVMAGVVPTADAGAGAQQSRVLQHQGLLGVTATDRAALLANMDLMLCGTVQRPLLLLGAEGRRLDGW